METIEIKPTEIICLQTNEQILDLDFLRKCLTVLLEMKTFTQKLFNDSLITDEKSRYEFERFEQKFSEIVRGNEHNLQRYLQEEWTTTDDFSTTLQTFCDPNMDNSEVTQAFITAVPASQVQAVDNLNASYNNLGEKKDVMAIAAAEVVMHSYRDGLYICGWPNCEYQTSSRRHINNHKLVHTGDGEFNCGFPECGRRFKTREELNEHSAVHNSDHPYPCVWPGCDFRSQTPASLKAHMRVHMERKYKCEWRDCNEEFAKITDLNRHRTVHDHNGIPANQSGVQTVQIVQSNQQAQQQNPQQVTVVSQQPSQQIAQIIAANQGQAGATIQPTQITGQLPSGQQVTLIQLQQPAAANVGTAIAHKTIVAQQPGTVNANIVPSTQPQPITTTIAVAGTNAMINTQLFKCNNPSCNSLFSTLYDLKQHMIQHSKVEKPFRCDFLNCEYSALTKTQLSEHKITHSNERNYVCNVENCGRRYKTRKGLWDHSHTHRSDKPFCCTYPNCTYRCVSSSYLRSHMRAHKDHNPNANTALANNVGNTSTTTSTTTIVANNAANQFFAPGTMIQHANGHQEYICGVANCNKSFDSQNAYLLHVKQHAPLQGPPPQLAHAIAALPQATVVPAPAPPPPPPPAPKSRNRNPELARFKCEFEGCNSAYKLKRNLKDHMIRHTILEKPYRCDWPGCDYGSYKSTNVAKHKSVHSDERKYACEVYNCEKKFKTREGLRKHSLSHQKPAVQAPVTNNVNTNVTIQVKNEPNVSSS